MKFSVGVALFCLLSQVGCSSVESGSGGAGSSVHLSSVSTGHLVTSDCYVWSGNGPLQDAVDAHDCVMVEAGVYELNSALLLHEGQTLTGRGSAVSVLKASQSNWQISCCDSLITTKDHNVKVSDLMLDGQGIAGYGIGFQGLDITRVDVTNNRCSAIGISGTGMRITNSLLHNAARTVEIPNRGTFNCATGNVGGVALGAGIYSEGRPGDRNFAPEIEGNTIVDNVGPAMDLNGSWGGTFKNNTVARNQGWAAVSLYGSSHWTIDGNTISHPNGEPVNQYHPACGRGPAGGHAAAIFLCEDQDTDGFTTNYNVISNNRSSSYYGILSVGAYSAEKPYLVPRLNSFLNNNVSGSNYGCADNFRPGQWQNDADAWSGNNCSGTANSGPGYFY